MRIFSSLIIMLAIALLVFAARAEVQGPFNPRTSSINDGQGPSALGGVSTPQPVGKILLADGSSFVLKTDGVSKVCRAGGC